MGAGGEIDRIFFLAFAPPIAVECCVLLSSPHRLES
jgi:hypothetical protein